MPAPITNGELGSSVRAKINESFTDFSSHSGAGGAVHANAVSAGAAGFMTGADKAKLDGIATAATANSADATLLARENHTGTQAASTISDFSEAVDDRVSSLLVAGAGVTLTYNDGANTLTVASSGGGGGGGPGLDDGDYGDVTVSSSGTVITIDSAAVTLAKLANLAQDQFIGRTTASTGVPQTATITAAARTVLDDTTVAAMVNTLGGATSTGTGGLVRATSPTLVTPALGTPSSGVLTNCTGLPATAIADGTVSDTEFQHLNGVTSALQTQLDAKLDAAIATDITATKVTPIGADQIILLDSADTGAPKLATISSLPTVSAGAPVTITHNGAGGEPVTGDTLTIAFSAGYSGTVQWTRDAVDIVGATSSTYVAQVADEGATVTARVTSLVFTATGFPVAGGGGGGTAYIGETIATGTDTITGTLPAGVTATDTVFAIIAGGDHGLDTTGLATYAGPTGWTPEDSATTSTNGTRMFSAPGNVADLTFSVVGMRSVTLIGVTGSRRTSAMASRYWNFEDSIHTSPSVVAGAGDLLISIYIQQDGAAPTFGDPTTDYTAQFTKVDAPPYVRIATRASAPAGATGDISAGGGVNFLTRVVATLAIQE